MLIWNLSACTWLALIAYSISSIGLVICGFSCKTPLSTCVMLSNSPVMLSSRSPLSRILSASSFCSGLSPPTRLSASSCWLIRMADIGVFSSWEMVEMKVVFATSSLWNSVMFFSMITIPPSFTSPSLSVIFTLRYFTWK